MAMKAGRVVGAEGVCARVRRHPAYRALHEPLLTIGPPGNTKLY